MNESTLLTFYELLYTAFGPQGWWPGRTRFEMITGAILTQNTAWTNVERAIRNLKKAGLLSPRKMHSATTSELSELIIPAGYFNVKARRLKNFTDHLFERHGGNLTRLFAQDTLTLRQELLLINGIGPETADSIVLYAAGKPAFVIDAYTKRILTRHGLIGEEATYGEMQRLFTTELEADTALYNEYHALIVKTGKDYCRPKAPKCGPCPLGALLPEG